MPNSNSETTVEETSQELAAKGVPLHTTVVRVKESIEIETIEIIEEPPPTQAVHDPITVVPDSWNVETGQTFSLTVTLQNPAPPSGLTLPILAYSLAGSGTFSPLPNSAFDVVPAPVQINGGLSSGATVLAFDAGALPLGGSDVLLSVRDSSTTPPRYWSCIVHVSNP